MRLVLCTLRFAFLALCSSRLAFQPTRSSRRNPPGSVFYPPGAAIHLVCRAVEPTHFSKAFTSWAGWTGRTLFLSTDGRTRMRTGFQSLQLNYSSSMWMSS